MRILREHAPRIGLPAGFVIYDEDDRLTIVKEAMRELQFDERDMTAATAVHRLSHAKNQMVSVEEAERLARTPREERIASLYRVYETRLRAARAVDFDDLLLLVVRLFETSPASLDWYRGMWKYVLVDEYQDTNRAQYRIIRLLTEEHRNLCVVGDPDQSVYRWRGADLRNILDFEKDFPDCRVVALEQNYRSTKQILRMASAVIEHNTARKDKRLWTENPEGSGPRYTGPGTRTRRPLSWPALFAACATPAGTTATWPSSTAPTPSRVSWKTRSAGPPSPTSSWAGCASTSAAR